MSDRIAQIGPRDAEALFELLTKDVARNLYFLGLLEEFGFRAPEGHGRFAFWGAWENDALAAALFVGHDGALMVPAGRSERVLRGLCESLASQVRPRAMLGDRAQVEVALRGLGGGKIAWQKDTRLLRVSADDLGPFTNPTLRLAREDDLDRLMPLAVGAVKEIFGRDPSTEDPKGFTARVRQRIAGKRTYVLEEDGQLVFKVDVGSRCRLGAELEGLYTVPECRHAGHATLSLGQICRHLLSSMPRLVLRVDEDSSAARVARKVGFVPEGLQRMIVMA